MNNYLFLVIWLVSILCYGHGQRTGNPDDTAKIERPCPNLDIYCIQKFFEKHAHCKKVDGPTPDPLYRPKNTVFISRVNLTITLFNEEITNTRGRIEEFYINRDTDKVVLAVEFTNQTHSSDKTFFRFHRRAKEPVVTYGSFSASYTSFVVTAVIPKIENMQLRRAECVSFNNDSDNRMYLSPSLGESKDSQVQQTITDMRADMPTTIQEFFATEGQYFMTTYIQYNICDFGLLVA